MKILKAIPLLFISPFLMIYSQSGDLVVQPGSTSLGASISHTTFDRFYAGEELQPGVPGGGDIERTSYRLYAETGVAQNFSVDGSTGYATTEAGVTKNDDFTDVHLGLNWQYANQESSFADMKLRVDVIIATDYETGRLSAVGDGENVLDVSTRGVHEFNDILSGKFEAGFSLSDGETPDFIRFNVGPQLELGDGVALDFKGIFFQGSGGIDIGGPEFNGFEDLPRVEENGLIGEAGLSINSDFGYYRFSVSQLFDGANIGEELTFGIYTGFGF